MYGKNGKDPFELRHLNFAKNPLNSAAGHLHGGVFPKGTPETFMAIDHHNRSANAARAILSMPCFNAKRNCALWQLCAHQEPLGVGGEGRRENDLTLPLGDLDLSHIIFDGNDVTGTNFGGADLFAASGLETTTGTAIYSHLTTLPDNFDPQAAGWSYVTPEPATIITLLLGFLLCPWRSLRRGGRSQSL